MTAEIAILNREAVALAADSAVTVTGSRGQKIFTSANKIFALSASRPVGVMIYGDAEILRVPWETIIKLYRSQLGDTSFARLEQYADDFLRFIAEPPSRFFPGSAQEEYVGKAFVAYLEELVIDVDERVESYLEDHDRITDAQVRRYRDAVIKEAEARVSECEPMAGLPADYPDIVRKSYSSTADEAAEMVLQRLWPRGAMRARIRDLLLNTLGVLHPYLGPPPVETGVVVAGFGEDEIFPHLNAYSVEGVAAGVLKHHPYIGAEITSMELAATVFPFAQDDMVVPFMEGVDRTYQHVVEEGLHEILTEYPGLLLDKLEGVTPESRQAVLSRLTSVGHEAFVAARAHLEHIRKEFFIDPVMELVDSLPKDELAAMAEALVNLTSLKRRFSQDAETVAGPIDVAVISKGDGFIWMRRKHYFPADLNPRYFARTHGGYGSDKR